MKKRKNNVSVNMQTKKSGVEGRLLLVRMFLFFGIALNLYFTQTGEAMAGESVRLAIPDFTQRGGQRIPHLSRALPEVVVTGLLANPNIEYVDRTSVWRTAMKRNSLEAEVIRDNHALLYSEEALKRLKVDLVLYGSFSEYGGEIRLDGYLIDRRSEKQERVRLSSYSAKISNVYPAVADLVKELKSAITSITSDSTSFKLAFLCFEEQGDKKSELRQRLSNWLPLAIQSYAIFSVPIDIVQRSESQDLCLSVEKGYTLDKLKNISKQTFADAIVYGNYTATGNEIVLRPTIYLSELQQSLVITEISADLRDLESAAITAADDITAVIDAINTSGKSVVELLGKLKDLRYEDYMRKGKELLSQKDGLSLAAFMFTRAKVLSPKSVEAYRALSAVRRLQDRHKDSLFNLKKAQELEPDSDKVLAEMAIAYLGLDNQAEAREILDSIDVKSTERDPEFGFYYGLSNYSLGNFEEAIKWLTLADKLDKLYDRQVEIKTRLGESYLYTEQLAVGLDLCQQALELDPNHFDAKKCVYQILIEQSQKYVQKNDLQEGLRQVRLAKKVRATEETLTIELYILKEAGEFEELLEVLSEYEGKGIVNDGAYVLGAMSMSSINRQDQALELIDKVKTNNSVVRLFREKILEKTLDSVRMELRSLQKTQGDVKERRENREHEIQQLQSKLTDVETQYSACAYDLGVNWAKQRKKLENSKSAAEELRDALKNLQRRLDQDRIQIETSRQIVEKKYFGSDKQTNSKYFDELRESYLKAASKNLEDTNQTLNLYLYYFASINEYNKMFSNAVAVCGKATPTSIQELVSISEGAFDKMQTSNKELERQLKSKLKEIAF